MNGVEDIPVGSRIRVTQQTGSPSRESWTQTIEGELLDCYVESRSVLGNAFASSPSGQFPLLCLSIRFDDRSESQIVVNEETIVESVE